MKLVPGELDFTLLQEVWCNDVSIELADTYQKHVVAAQELLFDKIEQGEIIYGVNTGFGQQANQKISADQRLQLQKNLIFSHATGVGEELSDKIVQLVLLLKINTLAQGYSGVGVPVIELLLQFYNLKIYPCLSSQGSVGASGDLAPLAQLACALIGEGEAKLSGQRQTIASILSAQQLTAIDLKEKEGLSLINGLQVSTAIMCHALFHIERIFLYALLAGSLSLEATRANSHPFAENLNTLRRQQGQNKVAQWFRYLIADSQACTSESKLRVQEPYCLRCQPQVIGACVDNLQYVVTLMQNEINAVTDNPIVFKQSQEILSGGNFHGEPIAFAADILALTIAEMTNLSERRIAVLCDEPLSGVPNFLIKGDGLNSGFMNAHVTASSLTNENRHYANPLVTDNIRTSVFQEDHISFATRASYRLLAMIENCYHVLAIELIAACQGLDFHHPQAPAPRLQNCYAMVREHVPFIEADRVLARDITQIKNLLSAVHAPAWLRELSQEFKILTRLSNN